jgi:GAF domain-containing protein
MGLAGSLYGQESERSMIFAARLRESLEVRGSQVPLEVAGGATLEHVLSRHLKTVELMAEGELITSILLLSADGKRLSHGAAPNLPDSYRAAIDGSAIGPCAGSCGTAAYLGRPIYVTDIAVDPLWSDYRHLALPHGLRSCWSTPIRDGGGTILGTFAIYRRTAGHPTREEIDAIEMISGHVAQAIMLARQFQDIGPAASTAGRDRARLRLVGDDEPTIGLEQLLRQLDRLALMAAELDRHAQLAGSEESEAALKTTAEDARRLISAIVDQIRLHRLS